MIRENEKQGYINAKGEMVIPPQFDETYGFSANGLAPVMEKGKSGYIDAKGQTVVFTDKLCGTEVLKNARGEVVWPQKSAGQICEERRP